MAVPSSSGAFAHVDGILLIEIGFLAHALRLDIVFLCQSCPLFHSQPIPSRPGFSSSFLVFIYVFTYFSSLSPPILIHNPFLGSLVPAAAAAVASSSDFRTGPSLWSLSAAHAQHHLPSTLRLVQTPACACPSCWQKARAGLLFTSEQIKLD